MIASECCKGHQKITAKNRPVAELDADPRGKANNDRLVALVDITADNL